MMFFWKNVKKMGNGNDELKIICLLKLTECIIEEILYVLPISFFHSSKKTDLGFPHQYFCP